MADPTPEAETEHVIVVGAGPSGLAAALELCRGGETPLVLERGDDVGGLMKSFHWNGFSVDLGRKELYTRFSEVDDLWSAILGDDYLPYPHRVGSLHSNMIVELSGRPRGLFRGIPLPLLIRGGLSMLGGWARSIARRPGSYEDYWHDRTGRVFAGLLAQGYWEKFRGRRWRDMPAPETDIDGAAGRSHSFSVVQQAFRLARRGGVAAQGAWRHPLRGSGQIFEALYSEIQRLGGRVLFNNEVVKLQRREDGRFDVHSVDGETSRHRIARHVISSLPLETLSEHLGVSSGLSYADADETRRSVVMVHLFLDRSPSFPHAWLEVNDPRLRIGRVTSYSAFGGEMVPAGKGCLCVEFFCQLDDDIVALDDAGITKIAADELSGAGLLDGNTIIGSVVRRLPRTNAAASWREQQTDHRQALLGRIREFENLYHVNRPGSDWATLAGLLAAQSILTGCTAEWQKRGDPTIRHSEAFITAAKSSADR